MSRMQLETPQKAQAAVDALYEKLANRLAANPNGLCPVETCEAFLRLSFLISSMQLLVLHRQIPRPERPFPQALR